MPRLSDEPLPPNRPSIIGNIILVRYAFFYLLYIAENYFRCLNRKTIYTTLRRKS